MTENKKTIKGHHNPFTMVSYLGFYNLILAAGWSYVLLLLLSNLVPCSLLAQYERRPLIAFSPLCFSPGAGLLPALRLYQTAALLEIVHAKLGIVPTKVFTTVGQVSSRIVLVWMVCSALPETTNSVAFFWMVFAWSLTEIIRYSWYASKITTGSAPRMLTWLRYSLFVGLYPIGVLSELWILASTSRVAANLPLQGSTAPFHELSRFIGVIAAGYAYLLRGIMLLYIPIFPQLYRHMFKQRKVHLGKRSSPSKPTAVIEGVQFPIVPSKGDRSSLSMNQTAFAMSVMAVDYGAAMDVMQERSWRFNYDKHVVRNVELCCRDAETCVKIAKNGLDFLHSHVEFVRGTYVTSLRDAMEDTTDSFPGTHIVAGSSSASNAFSVPYRRSKYPEISPVESLEGEELRTQLQHWADRGTIEPSARDALVKVLDNPEWTDLSQKYFVLLGAGSAMGPLELLLKHGANVIAVDIDRPAVWKRMTAVTEASAGTLTIPLRKPAEEIDANDDICNHAGCNLLTETPEIANWLCSLFPDRDLTIGCYAYLDGEAHVRVAMAMDAIVEKVIKNRPSTTRLAYLCSPTDVFVCTEEAHCAMRENYIAHQQNCIGSAVRLIQKLYPKKYFIKNAQPPVKSFDETPNYIVDGIIKMQGPNYALAKRIQHWRAMIARSAGITVSSNIAPSSATVSVVHNKQFAIAYGGLQNFNPMEIFFQETSNAVMAGLLIHDMFNTEAAANGESSLKNPIQLFSSGAFHGGICRCGYKIGSIGTPAFIMYYLGKVSFLRRLMTV